VQDILPPATTVGPGQSISPRDREMQTQHTEARQAIAGRRTRRASLQCIR